MNDSTTLDLIPTGDGVELSGNMTGIPSTTNLDLPVSSPLPSCIYNCTQTDWPPTDGSARDEPSQAALWTYLAVRILCGLLAIIGNSLTIFAVSKFERLQTCTNYLICSLAVSDLLSGIMVPLVVIHELYYNTWVFIPVCLIQQTLAFLSLSGTSLSILYLSIDRYIYIAFPLRYHTLVTPQREVILLTVTWINCLISAPTMVFTGHHLHVNMPCRLEVFLNELIIAIYVIPQIILVFFMTIGFHLAIAKIAHKQARQIAAEQQPYSTLAGATYQSTKKISHTLGLVLGVYVVSIMPQVIMGNISFNIKPNESIEKFTVAIYWANAWVNPLIYAWRLKDFRIAFKKIFTGTGSFIEVPGINA